MRLGENKMYGIEILVDEHKNILRLLDCMSASSYGILKGEDVDVDLFKKYIDMARNYADKHHHGKEELILFKHMVDTMGAVAEKLVNYGMLIEHDYGRLYLTSLDEALDAYRSTGDDKLKLDIIANTIGYVNHLRRHIDKEDNVIYTFAERELSDEIKKTVNKETEIFEDENLEKVKEYITWLDEISNKLLA